MRVSRLSVRIVRFGYPDTAVQGESAVKKAQRHMHMYPDMYRAELFTFCIFALNINPISPIDLIGLFVYTSFI